MPKTVYTTRRTTTVSVRAAKESRTSPKAALETIGEGPVVLVHGHMPRELAELLSRMAGLYSQGVLKIG